MRAGFLEGLFHSALLILDDPAGTAGTRVKEPERQEVPDGIVPSSLCHRLPKRETVPPQSRDMSEEGTNGFVALRTRQLDRKQAGVAKRCGSLKAEGCGAPGHISPDWAGRGLWEAYW